MRILVTGIGILSPLGPTAAATMDALLAGERGFRPVSLFDTAGCRSDIAGEIAGIDVAAVAPKGAAESWSRTDVMAVTAAKEALAHARLTSADCDLVLGGTTAGMYETEDLLAQMHRDPEARRPLEKMLSHPLSSTIDHLRHALGGFAKARTVCSACSSGANAMIMAATWLLLGRSQRVLAGGADGLCRLTYSGFSCLSAMSSVACRPFDAERDGLTLGEAGAFLVLETDASAAARGVEPIAELSGWAAGAEGHHITNPEASGATAARTMTAALARADLSPADIDYVNAHGTATKLNDSMESTALAKALGDEVKRVFVSSSKGQLGHTLGAAGAIEAAITAMAIERGQLPPTVGLETPDAECAVRHVRVGDDRALSIRAAMSNSFGFGGSDTVVVLSKPGQFAPLAEVSARRVVISAGATIGPAGVADAAGTRSYLAPGDAPGAGASAFDAKDHLDLARIRRIDQAGRMCAAAIGAAPLVGLDEPSQRERVGAVLGAAFGSVDACSAFVHRIIEKGARFASPAVFPNLLPSSPVGHAGIYHQLGGLIFATADLGATAESAMAMCAELVAAGEADAMYAGGVEEASPLTENVLGPLLSARASVERSEGAAALLIESAAAASARGVTPLGEILWTLSWRGAPPPALADAPPPKGRAVISIGADVPAEVVPPSWREVPRQSVVPRAGCHEAAGGMSAVAMLGQLAAAEIDSGLIVGVATDRGVAMVVGPAPGRS